MSAEPWLCAATTAAERVAGGEACGVPGGLITPSPISSQSRIATIAPVCLRNSCADPHADAGRQQRRADRTEEWSKRVTAEVQAEPRPLNQSSEITRVAASARRRARRQRAARRRASPRAAAAHGHGEEALVDRSVRVLGGDEDRADQDRDNRGNPAESERRALAESSPRTAGVFGADVDREDEQEERKQPQPEPQQQPRRHRLEELGPERTHA
jgi:hypothetical protein